MSRLMLEMVSLGFVMACLLATIPTRRAPPGVKATTDGMILGPSPVWMTIAFPPS